MGTGLDSFRLAFRQARQPVRRAALLQWTGDAPLELYEARRDGEEVQVVLFADGLVVESDAAPPEFAPFALVDEVAREGYEFTVRMRAGLAPVCFGRMGPRTDRFALDLAAAQAAAAGSTAAAYAAFDPALSALGLPDGWAADQTTIGPAWTALRASMVGTARAAEVALLESLAGPALRLGIKTGPGSDVLPFALAPVNGKVAVEAADADDRATFVFATDDVDRLNAALLLTSFRREAISATEAELGRWAVAVRLLEVVRWARKALVARVVHDEQWTDKVRTALQ